jgi:O-antigen/teichoic acid export membrane protein
MGKGAGALFGVVFVGTLLGLLIVNPLARKMGLAA